MWIKKIQLIFYSFLLILLSSCGEGFSIKDVDDTDGSSPGATCPDPLFKFNPLSKPNLFYQKNWISNKLQISNSSKSLKQSVIPFSIKIDKQCSSFLKASELSQVILNQSLTENIPSLNEQNYTYNVDKQFLINFQAQAELDFCIKTVSLDQSFNLIKSIPTSKKVLQVQKTLNSLTQNQKATTPSEDFNDTFLLRQTHLWALSAFEAFKEFYNETYGLQSTDTPSIVAIVDTPIEESHEDLNNLFLTTTIEPISSITNKDHGTHVAGLIAANTNNSLGTIGIASDSVKLISVGVVGENGDITSSNLENKLNEINTLPTNLKPQVINLSLELNTINCQDHASLSTSIKTLLDSGISIVVAAGNGIKQKDDTYQGQEFTASFLKYPACLSKVAGFEALISVGSVNIDNNNSITQKSEFSNYGFEYINIAAPGNSSLGGLYSTVSSPKNYNWKAGTSMSTPLVTAAAALSYSVLNKNRTQISSQSVFTQCRASQKDKANIVKSLILGSATKNSSFRSFWKDGNVLNLNNLIQKTQLLFPNTKKD